MYTFAKDVTPTVPKFTSTNAQGQTLTWFGNDAYIVNPDGTKTLMVVPGSATVQLAQLGFNGQQPSGPVFGNSTSPQAINDRGSVGGSYRDATNKPVGYVYDNGNYHTVDVPGSSATWVQGIANDGTIVGAYRDGATGLEKQFQATPHPF